MSLRTSLPALALVRPSAAAVAKQNVKFRAEASAEPGIFELDVYDIVDPIGENVWWGTTFVSAKDVRAKLKAAGDISKIIVRINSVGGDVFDGTAIYNLLKDHPAQVEVHVDGICASIASVIAMAGDAITMGQGTWMMIHEPYSQFMVDARSDDLRKAADTLDKMREGLCAVYCERTGIDEKECLALMQEETWMTADEALEKGFCTAINSVPLQTTTGDKPEIDSEEIEAAVAKLTRDYARMPAGALNAMKLATTNYAIAAMAAASAVRPRAEDDDADDKAKKMAEDLKKAEEDKKTLNDKVLELEKQKKDLEDELDKAKKAKASADDDDDEESSSGDDKDGKKAEAQAMARVVLAAHSVTGEKSLAKLEGALMALTASKDEVKTLKAQMAAIQQEKHAANVSKAIAAGKLIPAQKAWALAVTPENLQSYIDSLGDSTVGPVNIEHTPDDNAARARAQVDPKSVQLTADEKHVAKCMGLDETKVLAAKREALLASAQA
jgi:ATP-dependent protease ClpP protease subunit